MGFNNCPLFTGKGTIEKSPKKFKTHLEDCPLCGCKKESYCLNEIRMIRKVRSGVKLWKDVYSCTGVLYYDSGDLQGRIERGLEA